jgi:hypothetical protein
MKFSLPVGEARFRSQHKIQSISEGKDSCFLIEIGQSEGRLILLEGHCLLLVSHGSANLWVELNGGFADAQDFGVLRGKSCGA